MVFINASRGRLALGKVFGRLDSGQRDGHRYAHRARVAGSWLFWNIWWIVGVPQLLKVPAIVSSGELLALLDVATVIGLGVALSIRERSLVHQHQRAEFYKQQAHNYTTWRELLGKN